MDQGLAAVLGGAVGVLGTGLTASLAFWQARWVTRQQISGTNAQWRRQVQREAYGVFLERYMKLTRFLGETEKKIRVREYTEADAARVASSTGSQLDDLLTSIITVQLEGPAELGTSAYRGYDAMGNWWTALARLANSLDSGDPATDQLQAVAEAQREAGEQIGAFAGLAQQHLNEIR
ncbi:hypothetical protein [Streptomyces sp. NPDC019937]|uniref:hypothetical protein n=1 Tax=Streptomyces sp. NPDC019937 TaxID=3154787 RepID=UPI0033CA038E